MPAAPESYGPAPLQNPAELLHKLGERGAPFAQLASQAERAHAGSHDPSWIVPWALALWHAEAFEAALSVLERHAQQLQASIDFHVLRGMVLRRLPGRAVEALPCYKAALRLEPFRADIYFNLGNLLRDELNRAENAVRSYAFSLKVDPQPARTWLNYAISLQELERHEEALVAHHRGLCLDPANADAWNNAGLAHYALAQVDEALRFFRYSLDLNAQSAAAHVNVGNALIELCNPEQAIAHLEQGIVLEEEAKTASNALWNMSLVRLMLGEFPEGWSLYEARFGTKQFDKVNLPSSGPRVLRLDQLPSADAPPDQQLLVWSEQGMGDSIQFCRYLLLLRHRGVPFQYMTRRPLHRLMVHWLGLADAVVPDKSTDAETDPRPHIPLMSLPHLFGTDLETIPVLRGYLKAPEPTPANLRVAPPPGGISVGITWASNPDNRAMYHKKSLPLELLMPRLEQLMDLDLIEVHALQVGDDAAQLEPWRDHPRLTDWNGKLDDFADTAHVLRQLDLVIAVDTAVAHLAAALDRPVWLLLPANADFRWLQNRSDCPWYPSMRLFRQTARNDWPSVIAQLHAALDELFLLDIEALIASRTPAQLARV